MVVRKTSMAVEAWMLGRGSARGLSSSSTCVLRCSDIVLGGENHEKSNEDEIITYGARYGLRHAY